MIALGVLPIAACALRDGPQSATIAEIAVQLPMALAYIARMNGYWGKLGLHTKRASFSSGRLALDALFGRAAQFSYSAVTPLALAGLQRTDFRILTQISTSPNELSIITRRSSGIRTAADLVGKRVGYPTGTQAEYFFDKYLDVHGVNKGHIVVVSAAPPECVSAIVAREVDAIVAFKPHSLNAMAALGLDAALLDTRGLYTSIASLICTAEVSEKNPELVHRMLAGLIKAEQFCREQPGQALHLVAQAIHMKDEVLQKYFSEYDFRIVLSGALLKDLVEEGQWGARRAQAKTKPPDYRSLIAASHLRALDPHRVEAF
jgi:NitT/TauT family transport system substrate-binding protein